MHFLLGSCEDNALKACIDPFLQEKQSKMSSSTRAPTNRYTFSKEALPLGNRKKISLRLNSTELEIVESEDEYDTRHFKLGSMKLRMPKSRVQPNLPGDCSGGSVSRTLIALEEGAPLEKQSSYSASRYPACQYQHLISRHV